MKIEIKKFYHKTHESNVMWIFAPNENQRKYVCFLNHSSKHNKWYESETDSSKYSQIGPHSFRSVHENTY